MIENDQQYQITKHWLTEFRNGIATFDFQRIAAETSETLARAQVEAMESEVDILEGQVREYENRKFEDF